MVRKLLQDDCPDGRWRVEHRRGRQGNGWPVQSVRDPSTNKLALFLNCVGSMLNVFEKDLETFKDASDIGPWDSNKR